ncbi:MAG: glycosyltransferase [Candidatus Omnitrophica bacterium]|nr:glycosyltransferase [Candidatus Omnitrophota bacterium]MBU1925615.1 glycosyltransferase [Candidatus Omnitrophota bacterium]
MPNEPLVSICIPTYNNGQYIAKTLTSVINQSYKNLEIVISDNASTDQTYAIVKTFSDNRLRYCRIDKHINGLFNFNKAIQLAKGNFIAVYHSDDIYEPTIVQKELQFLLNYPEAGAVFALDTLIDRNDKIIGTGVRQFPPVMEKNIYNFHDILQAMIKKNGSFLVCPTFMTRSDVLAKVGLFDPDCKYGVFGGAGDADMWLKIAQSFKIGIINERLIKRRISTTQDSSTYELKRITRANHFTVIDDYLACSGLVREVDRTLLAQYEFNKFFDDMMIAKNFLKLNRLNEAKSVLLRLFSWKRFLFGFKNKRNFCIIIIFLILLISINFGLPGLGVGLFRVINKYKLSVPA